MDFPSRRSLPSTLVALCVLVASFVSCLDQYQKKTLNSLKNNIASFVLYSFSGFFPFGVEISNCVLCKSCLDAFKCDQLYIDFYLISLRDFGIANNRFQEVNPLDLRTFRSSS